MPKANSKAADRRGIRSETPFSEAAAWRSFGDGWRPLFGSFRSLGFSFEWHDLPGGSAMDWSRSFHPGSVELCLNLEGRGVVTDKQRTVELGPRTFTFYYQGDPPLIARREGGGAHRFITVELSGEFLDRHFQREAEHLHPIVRSAIRQSAVGSEVMPIELMSATLLQLVDSLRRCPVFKPAQEIWFTCKAVELAALLFFRPSEGEFFCTRQQRVSRERIEKLQSILRERLSDPPALEELGRMVGCSPFYLSRQFSQETGVTIQQFIRQIRLERAAELLRTGQCNVTEAAFEVGYSSLSHFTVAFREAFGCCPGLYPMRKAHPDPE